MNTKRIFQTLSLALAISACGGGNTTQPLTDAGTDSRIVTDTGVNNDTRVNDNGVPNQDTAVTDNGVVADATVDSSTSDASGNDSGTLAPLVCTDLPVLNCGDTAVAGSTTAVNAINAYCGISSYSGAERLYRLNVPGTQEVQVTLTANAGVTRDFDLFTYASDGTSCAPPTTLAACNYDRLGGPNGTATFGSTATAHDFIVAYDGYLFDTTVTASYSIAVTCTPAICGDGNRRANEACDDSNTADGDGCSSTCEVEANYTCTGAIGAASTCARCGDGVRIAAERCDDGNNTAGDGCSATCTIETNFSCIGEVGAVSICTAIVCGDGNRASSETCDDGNTDVGDGCSATCTQEANFSCTGAVGTMSVCVASCGNGTRAFPETCDDGNTSPGDGCSATCTIESGFDCSTASPSVCVATVCGDGNRRANEPCDDSNTAAGDGCSPTCTVEGGYSCTTEVGFRSVCTNTCNNGTINSNESCEDGNALSGDGCSSSCSTEPGFVCPTVGVACIASTHSVTALTGQTCSADTETWTAVVFSSMSDDSASAIIPFPGGFTFAYGGATITGFSVTTNGYIQLWTGTTGTPSTTYTNARIPNADAPNAFIAPLWDDLYPGTAPGPLGTARFALVNGNLVVQWNNWKLGSSGDTTTFQLALALSGVIDFTYCSGFTATGRLSGNDATIGVENATGTGGTLISHNAAGAVSNGTGYRLTPR